MNTPTPHIAAKQGEIAPSILLPGDPLRAKFIAENFLAGAKQFNATRNMFGYTGFYRDKPVSVMGTGMGCPSIGIYSHELIEGYGVKTLIRVGTTGAISEDVHIRDLVFAMGACTPDKLCKRIRSSGRFRTDRGLWPSDQGCLPCRTGKPPVSRRKRADLRSFLRAGEEKTRGTPVCRYGCPCSGDGDSSSLRECGTVKGSCTFHSDRI